MKINEGAALKETRRRALADMETAVLRHLGPPIADGKHRPVTAGIKPGHPHQQGERDDQD